MKFLITGGAGYIGSHTVLTLAQQGHDVTVFDNLCNSQRQTLERVGELLGRPVRLIEGDVRHLADLARAFAEPVDAVIHFAALKAVGESCRQPLRYFDNNISGTVTLLQAMEKAGVRRLVFSSSATVYGDPDRVPIDEHAPLRVTNPYGRTKLVMEDLIRDYCGACADFGAVLLRYFNPVGAHPSGRIGEDPAGEPANLMPYVCQVAAGRRETLQVFGDDYPTPDGTGIRDYLHVMDLAEAHARASDFVAGRAGCHVFNLGTGRGHSVLEIIHTFERVTGARVPYRIVGRRAGDVAAVWADTGAAQTRLSWRATRDLAQMCEDAWRWECSRT